MTIKQQGGVFGRNPTFNDVDVDGDFYAKNGARVDGSFGVNVDPTVTADFEQSLSEFPLARFFTNGRSSPISAYGPYIGLLVNSYQASGGPNYTRRSDIIASADTGANADLNIWTKAKGNSGPTKVATFGDTGNLSLLTGNLIVPSGNGIDFSATSGTGTSELFDDYEEGTWTPAFSIFSGSFSAITYNARTGGWYTKIGNTVHVNGYIATDSLTVGTDGELWITGLPFTSSNTQPGFSGYTAACVGEAKNWTAKAPSSLYVYPNNTFMVPLYRATSDGNVLTLLASDLATGSQDNELSFAATYTVD